MSRQKWDGTIDKELTINYILYLWEGYKNYGHDKYACHIIYYGVRKITEAIGLSKGIKISKEAQQNKFCKKIREHKKPAIQFFQEFINKKKSNDLFTREDAERWFDQAELVIITKEEDDKLTAKGWRDKKRPFDAYEKIIPPIEIIQTDLQNFINNSSAGPADNDKPYVINNNEKKLNAENIINSEEIQNSIRYIEAVDVRKNYYYFILIIFNNIDNTFSVKPAAKIPDIVLCKNGKWILKFLARKKYFKLVIPIDSIYIPKTINCKMELKGILYDNIKKIEKNEELEFINYLKKN